MKKNVRVSSVVVINIEVLIVPPIRAMSVIKAVKVVVLWTNLIGI